MWLKRLFSKACRAAKKIFIKIFKGAFGYVYSEVREFAEDVVERLEGVDISNDAKREEAFNEISKEVSRRGLSYKKNWVYTIINIALMTIRKEF